MEKTAFFIVNAVNTSNLSYGGVQSQKLKEVESKEKYRVEVSNRFAALEQLDVEVDINSALETIREKVKTSAKECTFL
jgi:hypothetical protein